MVTRSNGSTIDLSESPTLPPDRPSNGDDNILEFQLPKLYNGSSSSQPVRQLLRTAVKGNSISPSPSPSLSSLPRMPLSPSSSFTTYHQSRPSTPPSTAAESARRMRSTASISTVATSTTAVSSSPSSTSYNGNSITSSISSISSRKKKPSSDGLPSSPPSSSSGLRVVADHVAAALELTRTNPQIPPAPASGMYWSRAVTFSAKNKDAPPLRAHSACVVDDLLYVFGGSDTRRCFNVLHILDMESMTWSKPLTSGRPPPPSRAQTMTYVERKGTGTRELYVFGGGDGPHYFNEVYQFDIDALRWTKVATAGTPPMPRRAHTANLWKDDKIIIFGGGDGVHALNDVHILDLAASPLEWVLVTPTGTPPHERGYHTTTLVKDKLVVYGGSDGKTCFGDIHVLDLVTNTWTQIDTLDRIIPRLAHASLQIGSYIFVIGGHDGSRYSNQVLMLNLVSMAWETRMIYGDPIAARGYHAAVFHDSRIFLLGGYDSKEVFDDVHILELSACAYLPQITNFEI